MAELYKHDAIDAFLSSELDRRKQRNPNYSLRAFARDLGISVSRLSEVLNGKAGLSGKMALSLAERMKLPPRERKYWLDLILAGTARNQGVRALARKRVVEARATNRLREIREAEFQVVADWYHSAILELTQLQNFSRDPEWMAEQLGITANEATQAVRRLLSLGLLVERDGRLCAESEAYQAFSETPSKAIRKFHGQILHKAIDSLAHDTLAEREMYSMIVAIPKDQLANFGQKMQVFLQQFWEGLEGTAKDDLYAASLQLFPVRSSKARGKG